MELCCDSQSSFGVETHSLLVIFAGACHEWLDLRKKKLRQTREQSSTPRSTQNRLSRKDWIWFIKNQSGIKHNIPPGWEESTPTRQK